jgi:hypothetical protein
MAPKPKQRRHSPGSAPAPVASPAAAAPRSALSISISCHIYIYITYHISHITYYRCPGPPKGRRQKKMTKVTYICCSTKKQVVTYSLFFSSIFFNALFGRFITRGVQKHEKQIPKKSIWAHHTKCFFFVRPPPPSVVWDDLFNRVFGFWARPGPVPWMPGVGTMATSETSDGRGFRCGMYGRCRFVSCC